MPGSSACQAHRHAGTEQLSTACCTHLLDAQSSELCTKPGPKKSCLCLAPCRYRQAEEPQLPGHSVTIRPDAQLLQQLHKESQTTWTPPLARLMQV